MRAAAPTAAAPLCALLTQLSCQQRVRGVLQHSARHRDGVLDASERCDGSALHARAVHDHRVQRRLAVLVGTAAIADRAVAAIRLTRSAARLHRVQSRRARLSDRSVRSVGAREEGAAPRVHHQRQTWAYRLAEHERRQGQGHRGHERQRQHDWETCYGHGWRGRHVERSAAERCAHCSAGDGCEEQLVSTASSLVCESRTTVSQQQVRGVGGLGRAWADAPCRGQVALRVSLAAVLCQTAGLSRVLSVSQSAAVSLHGRTAPRRHQERQTATAAVGAAMRCVQHSHVPLHPSSPFLISSQLARSPQLSSAPSSYRSAAAVKAVCGRECPSAVLHRSQHRDAALHPSPATAHEPCNHALSGVATARIRASSSLSLALA